MAGWSFCASGLLHVCVILSVKAQWVVEDEGCRTPDRGVGNCIVIQSCKPISDLLDIVPQPIPPAIRNLLKSYHCGFDGNTPKVCCPSRPIDINQYIQIPSNEDRNAVPEPPTVTSHRNFNLLPKECGLVDTGDRIVHGNKTGLFEFPWMALLSYRTQRGPDFKCGATIINERYILTAAHCIQHIRYPLLGVRIGEHDISTKIDCEATRFNTSVCAPPYQDLAIEEIIPHPEYDRKSFSHDIGLLRVASPMNLRLENMKPVCLPVDVARNYNFTNRNVVVTGWGVTETGYSSPDLLKVQLPVISPQECSKIYKNIANISHTQMCAGGKTKSDSCGGDSGGPLQVASRLYDDDRMVQHGIVSFGPRDCGQEGLPGIYTKVVYYMDWILDSIKP